MSTLYLQFRENNNVGYKTDKIQGPIVWFDAKES